MIAEETFTHVPAYRPAPEAARVAEAARILKEAKRPVIVVGGGARLSGAGPEVLKLAKTLSIPVATSLNAMSLVPENNPLYIGVPGTYSRSCTNKILMRADLVLYIGSQTAGQVTHFWKIPPAGTPVIQIGIDPADLGRNYPNEVSLLGDAKMALQALNEAVGGAGKDSAQRQVGRGNERGGERMARGSKAAARFRRRADAPGTDYEGIGRLAAARHHRRLRHGPRGHVVARSSFGLAKPWDFIRAAGSLGWAFPASLGAKVAMPKKPVVCFTGDGGFWYHLQELETAVRCGIPTVTVVNNNNSLNQETTIFRHAYGGKPSKKQGEMWHFSQVNFATIAESMGALGIRVTKPGELRSALDRAISSGRPAVVEVMSDIEALAPNAWEG